MAVRREVAVAVHAGAASFRRLLGSNAPSSTARNRNRDDASQKPNAGIGFDLKLSLDAIDCGNASDGYLLVSADP